MTLLHAGEGRVTRLRTPPDFRLPWLEPEPPERHVHVSTHFDTSERRLARFGLALERRVENGKSTWRLELPPAGSASVVVEVSGGPVGPPRKILGLLGASLSGRELSPVATVRTTRESFHAEAAEIVLDSVTVLDAGHETARFAAVELHALIGDLKAVRKLEKRLRRAGADGKGDGALERALGRRPPMGSVEGRADAIRAALRAQFEELVTHDPGTRAGADPEALHKMRVAARRLRAVLRVSRGLGRPEGSKSLQEELRWLGETLGSVRDLDVFRAHLLEEVGTLDRDDQRACRRLLELLDRERAEARRELLAALRSSRYAALLTALEDLLSEPLSAAAKGRPAEVAAREFLLLRKAMRSLGPEPANESLHRARIKGKRARYAAELAAVDRGKPARRFVKRAKTFQDIVGEHQDAVVAEQELRRLLAQLRAGRATALAVGRLVERQGARRVAARAALPDSWRKLERSGTAAWS